MSEPAGRPLGRLSPWTELAPSAPFSGIADRLRGNDIHARFWRRGSDGDDGLGARLAKLEVEGWHHLSSADIGSTEGHIDHLAIGPGGVFTLNLKQHLGRRVVVDSRGVWVDGRPTPYLSDALDDAEQAGRLLSLAAGFPVFVNGVIVVTSHDLKHRARPDGITVVSLRQFGTWLRALPPRLTDDDVVIINDVARRATTWA